MNETGQEFAAALFGAAPQREDEQPASDATEDASEAADTKDEQLEPTESNMLLSMLQGKGERNRAIVESLHPSSAGD